MRTTVDHGVAIGRAPALMPTLIDDLRVHRCSNASLHVLPLRLAHPAQDAHQHLVRGIATIEPATELRNPDSRPYAAKRGAVSENWLPNQQRVPSPTTTPAAARFVTELAQQSGRRRPALPRHRPRLSDIKELRGDVTAERLHELRRVVELPGPGRS